MAKNWLQGQLKIHQQIFDHPFSTEIIRVSASGCSVVLDTVFDKSQLAAFKKGFDDAKRTKDAAQRVQIFKGLARKFAEGAAKAAGGGVVTVVKAHLGVAVSDAQQIAPATSVSSLRSSPAAAELNR